MKRLYLTVEGQTEAAFAMNVLQPHLANYGVFLWPPRYTGPHARRRGRTPRGGMFHTFAHSLSDMRQWLNEDRSADARFSMMVDLYSLPHDFPGYVPESEPTNGIDRAIAMEGTLASVVNDHRFIPYLQVHEFEALVLVDPERLRHLYDVTDARLRELCYQCNQFTTPEVINHGQHSHPKFRIQQCVPEYDENVASPLLAEDIGLPELRSRCPHFAGWLTMLERLDAE